MNAVPLYAFAVFLWGALPALIARTTSLRFTALSVWNLLGVSCLGLGLAGLSPKSFRQDSLWTLDRSDQAIVAGVTACLFAFGAWVTFRVALALTRWGVHFFTRAFLLAGNVILAAGSTYLFWLLSPQLYYAYYRLIFAGLPDQWVFRSPSDTAYFVESLALLPQNNLAQTVLGLSFWLSVALTVSVHAQAWRQTPSN